MFQKKLKLELKYLLKAIDQCEELKIEEWNGEKQHEPI